jgi:O-methyltransferase
MSLLNFIKNNLFVQNIAAWAVSKVPSYLEFTIDKYQAIKKALYITSHEKVLGSYLEFGVFTGSSFNFAMRANRSVDKLLGSSNCDFFGFDSFDGFGSVSKEDEHPRFKDSTFSVNEKKVLKNIKKQAKGQDYKIIKGFYDKTLKNRLPEEYEIKKARVIMIDCDLKEPTILILDYVKNILQQGTIILFDDFMFYKGDKEKGQYGAFDAFKKANPQLDFRRAFDYGNGSRAFIVCKV